MGGILSFSKEFLDELSEKTGFLTANLEKIGYLIRILKDISEHPFLKSRLALKGGTAINLFYFALPRLSVDIDLNYIGSPERETMLKEKGPVEEALTRILTALGFEVHRIPSQHAGGKWRLSFNSAAGGTQKLELDINYLMRVPFYGVERRKSFVTDPELQVPFPLVSFEEAFAGKLVAMLDRTSARDIYDVDQLYRHKEPYDFLKLKKATLLIGVCGRKDWRKITLDRIDRISEKDFKQQLRPLLPSGIDVDFDEMKVNCISLAKHLLQYDDNERAFLNDFLNKGEYKVELLCGEDSQLIERLHNHPAPLWKAMNIKRTKQKK
jgi:hypothetical protein